MKRVVCYSGGHSSALVAIELVRRFGNDEVVLLNHDINATVESPEIKRFKSEVADYLDIPITFRNMDGWDSKDQFDVVVEAGAFKVKNGTALCTNRLKTAPFEDYLEDGKWAEDEIGYTIIKGVSLLQLEPLFERMKAAGIEPTEKIPAATFWAMVRRKLRDNQIPLELETNKCECAA